jgi:hypothetical protein
VNFKSRRTLLAAVAVLAIAAAAVAGLAWYRTRRFDTATLLKRLPTQNALVLAVDFDALRRAGILGLLDSSKVTEDAEYRSFVQSTHFDYQRDLDSALAAFTATGKYLFVQGRFDWTALRAYAASQGGRCDGSLCRMQGSTPDRQISFFPLRSDLMAMAVSPDDSAVLRLKTEAPETAGAFPKAPMWVSIPMSTLQNGESLPDGTRAFARTLKQAQSLTISFTPDKQRIDARMEVLCRNEMDAADAALQLNSVTNLLRQMIEREHQKANPGDLSGVLTAGSFRPDGKRVLGYWPIERVFVENLLGSAPGEAPASR